MPTTNTRTIEQIVADRKAAESALAEAEMTANSLRVEHARAALERVFPQHTLAVFTRAWDQDKPRLMQLLSIAEGVDDIDFDEIDNSTDPSTLSREQAAACSIAHSAVQAMGTDDAILQHLDSGDVEHRDWYEFNLTLNG